MTKDNNAKKDNISEDKFASLQAEIEKLTDENELLKQQVEGCENNWKRALADYKNLQTRIEQEKVEIVRYAGQVLISRLISVLDNLEMIVKHSDDKGIELTLKEFKQILDEEGLEAIDSDNQEFDASTMEAIEMVEGETNKVIETVQKGYKLRDRVLRPAKVKVGKN